MAIIKTKFDRGVEGATNIVDSGTEGTKVASGTTAQRGSTTGQWRYNSTTGYFEGRGASSFSTLEPTPTITSVDVSEVASDGGGNQTIVITGSNFSSGGTISFRGSSANFDATTTTFNSVIQVTAVAPKASFLNAQEPYGVRFTASTGTFGEKAGLINVDSSPTWNTASGSLGSIFDSARTGVSLSATASDSDGDTITYSVQSGSLPGGLSLNTSTGAITGNVSAVGSDTTSSFTLRATANSKTADRAFTITVKAPVSTTYSYTGSNQTFTVPTGLTQITVDINGAGGGQQGNSGSAGHGGRTQGTRTVSAGQSYIIIVGGKGKTSSSGSAFGGGGSYTSGNGNGGGGGGLSGIFLTSYTHGNAVAIAGGGGGAAYGGATGGHGGGTTGNNAGTGGATGGSQSGGGAGSGGGGTGSALQGGSAGGNGNGGAGGGGYYGGGGGAEGSSDTSGAGGSGYIGGLNSGATTTTGGGNAAGNVNGNLIISY